VNAHEVNWAKSTRRRNTCTVKEWCCGEARITCGRSGAASWDAVTWAAPVNQREIQQRFWRKIAEGCPARTPPSRAGCRTPVGDAVVPRSWWHATDRPGPPSGRYLSFAEREEIALLRASAARGACDRPRAGPVAVNDLA
jgi:hypothetical protein